LDISNFLPTTLPKIRRVREMIEQINSGFDLEVDGGIDAETGPLAAAARANVLVSGTAVFGENEGVSTPAWGGEILMGGDKLPGRLVPRQTKRIFVSPRGGLPSSLAYPHLATVFAHFLMRGLAAGKHRCSLTVRRQDS
jgi:hypothetical protein